ncbi:MAG: hypothetical protein JW974_00495 [Alphaproteobacteria bacterium]|nr:hypothetical protein [Alphaproteobacteria bacterium]MBN2675228.1 hypothetical protein [Alphaproteobacteria bacterium]
MLNKLKLYDAATEKLVDKVRNMKMPDGFSACYDMEQIVYLIREGFKDKKIREQLLLHKYEEERFKNCRFSAGFCGISSYIWNHLFRAPDGSEIWRLKQISNNEMGGLKDHVWVENVYDFSKLDFTFDQSMNEYGQYFEIPYELGKYADSNFKFQRAYKFAEFIGINLNHK